MTYVTPNQAEYPNFLEVPIAWRISSIIFYITTIRIECIIIMKKKVMQDIMIFQEQAISWRIVLDTR